MPKEEWGVKRICPTTGRRFYDLNKTPIVSPYTGETVTLDANTNTRVAVVEKAAPKEEEINNSDEDDLLDEGNSTNSAVGDDVLDDDEDENISLDDIADVPADDSES